MRVLVYPFDRNPYQTLLYSALRAELGGCLAVGYLRRPPLLGLLTLPIQLLGRRAQGYRLLHVHWQRFEVSPRIPFSRFLGRLSYIALLKCIGWMGYTVVWTVHNVTPHERQTNDDLAVARTLAQAASAVIVHSEATIEAMRRVGIRTDHAHVIPHGNYVGVYDECVARSEARMSLGLPGHAFVILAFGLIRRYKGLSRLLDALSEWPEVSVRLVVAGASPDRGLLERLRQAAGERVVLREGYVSDRDVGLLFGACDVVCAPFLSVTTSGSVILAMSLGRPIVAPRIGALAEAPSDVGFFYDPDDPDGLGRALREAHSHPGLEEVGRAARRYAETLSWPPIARATLKVYEELLQDSQSAN